VFSILGEVKGIHPDISMDFWHAAGRKIFRYIGNILNLVPPRAEDGKR
jgi:hypothetical protein